MVKKMPDWMKNWKENMTRPPVICRLANIDGRNSGSRPDRSRWTSHSIRAARSSSPARTSQKTSDTPAMAGASGFGPDPAPGARPQDAVDRQGEAHHRQHRADQSNGYALLRGRCRGSVRRKARMTTTITTSPTKTQRHEANVVTAPPISGPAATAMAPAAAISP